MDKRRDPTSRLLRGVAIVVAGILAIPCLLALWFFSSMYGGLDNLLAGEGPSQNDPEVRAALARVEEPLDDEAASVADLVLVSTNGQAQLLARGKLPPRCSVGQHDWMRDDSYDLLCFQERSELIVVSSRSSLDADMTALSETLRDEHWWPQPTSLADSMAQYRQTLAAWHAPQIRPPAEFPQPVRYDGYADGRNYSLEIRWVSRDSQDTIAFWSSEKLVLVDPGGEPADIARTLHRIPRDGYAVELRLEVEYFRD